MSGLGVDLVGELGQRATEQVARRRLGALHAGRDLGVRQADDAGEHGAAPAVRLIESRLDTTDRSLRDTLGAPQGMVTAIDPQGAARVEHEGRKTRVTLAQYFGLHPDQGR